MFVSRLPTPSTAGGSLFERFQTLLASPLYSASVSDARVSPTFSSAGRGPGRSLSTPAWRNRGTAGAMWAEGRTAPRRLVTRRGPAAGERRETERQRDRQTDRERERRERGGRCMARWEGWGG